MESARLHNHVWSSDRSGTEYGKEKKLIGQFGLIRVISDQHWSTTLTECKFEYGFTICRVRFTVSWIKKIWHDGK